MKHLLLLRHAEAEAAPPGSNDSERALTEHGRLQATQAAQCVAQSGLEIDAMLVSPARRTRETACIVHRQLSLSIAPRCQPDLYLGSADTLLGTIHACDAATHTLLLVAHNPGISELAHALSGGALDRALGTAGLCHLAFERASWSELGTPALAQMLR